MTVPVVTYDEGPPRKYTVNGEKVPSVTQILGVLDKPALPWWGMTTGVTGICKLRDLGVEIPWDDPEGITKLLTEHKLTVNHVRDAAATRGQSIHAALEQWVTEQEVPALGDFPMEDRRYVQALASFLLDYEPECERSEVMVGSAEHGFAGRYDLRCRIRNRDGILDLKTGKKLYDPVHLQLAAYALADFEMGAAPVDTTWALRLGADGEYELVEGRADAAQFLAVLGTFNALRALKAAKRRKKAAA